MKKKELLPVLNQSRLLHFSYLFTAKEFKFTAQQRRYNYFKLNNIRKEGGCLNHPTCKCFK